MQCAIGARSYAHTTLQVYKHMPHKQCHLPFAICTHVMSAQGCGCEFIPSTSPFFSQKPVEIDAHNHNPDSELRQVPPPMVSTCTILLLPEYINVVFDIMASQGA